MSKDRGRWTSQFVPASSAWPFYWGPQWTGRCPPAAERAAITQPPSHMHPMRHWAQTGLVVALVPACSQCHRLRCPLVQGGLCFCPLEVRLGQVTGPDQWVGRGDRHLQVGMALLSYDRPGQAASARQALSLQWPRCELSRLRRMARLGRHTRRDSRRD